MLLISFYNIVGLFNDVVCFSSLISALLHGVSFINMLDLSAYILRDTSSPNLFYTFWVQCEAWQTNFLKGN